MIALIFLLALAQPFEWVAVGPERGTVTAIATGGPVLAGSAQGRIFRFSDSGSWIATADLGAPVHSIDVKSRQPFVVAGTGLYRLTENGWVQTLADVTCFEVAPSAPDILYACGSALRSSVDAGATWQTREGGALSLAVDAGDPRTLWIVRPDGVLEKSVDGGVTSSPVAGVTPPIVRVQSHPSRPATAFAIGDSGRGYRTTNGTTWSALHYLTGTITFDPIDGQSFYIVNESGHVYRTESDGERLEVVNSGPVVSLEADRDGTLYAGFFEQGILRSTDRGVTWTPHRQGLHATEVHSLAASLSGDVVYAGSVWTVFRTTDGGATWHPVFNLRPHPGPFSAIAVDPTNPQRVWIGAHVSLWFSADAGAEFNRRFWSPGLEPQTVRDLEFDAADRRAVWVLMSQSFFHFNVESMELTELSLPHHESDEYQALAVDPTNPRSLWIGGRRGANPLLLHSRDAGTTWQDLSHTLGSLSGHAVSVLYIGHVILAGTTGGRILRSDDGGARWITSDHGISGGGRIRSIGWDGQTLFAAANGVFMSQDGSTWRDVSGAIGNQPVTALTSSDIVFAGTIGAGVYVQRPAAARPRTRAVGR